MNDENDGHDETMNEGLHSAERERLKAGLESLPDSMPPRAVWHRIEEQARAEGLIRDSRRHERIRWLAGAGLAAAVALAVLRWPGDGGETGSDTPFPTEPSIEVAESQVGSGLQAVNALMVRSRQLERNLRALPGQPSVVRASTVATISELEDRIATIDFRLNQPGTLTPAEAEAYWRERVRLMDSLLQLRYAQVQRMSF